MRGNIKALLKDYYGAIEDFDKILEINSDVPDIHFMRGCIKFELQDYNEATEDFIKEIEISKTPIKTILKFLKYFWQKIRKH